MEYKTEFLDSLGINATITSVGYWFVESDMYIGYWSPNSTGSIRYEGHLSVDKVVDALNAETKRLYAIVLGLHSLEPFDLRYPDALDSLCRNYDFSLNEAKSILEGKFGLDTAEKYVDYITSTFEDGMDIGPLAIALGYKYIDGTYLLDPVAFGALKGKG